VYTLHIVHQETNSRVVYQIYCPAPGLRPYVENYWILQSVASDDQPLNEQIFVDGKADIIFNFGVPYQRTGQNGAANSIAYSNVDAQRTYPVTIAQAGAISLIGIRFAPGGLSHFIRMPMHELSNHVLGLDDAFGQGGKDLEDQLYEARADHERQIRLLDRFLMMRFDCAAEQRLLLHIAHYLRGRHGNASVMQIGDQFGYSVRSVDRFFRRYMGLSPKWYLRSLRLQYTLKVLSDEPSISMAELAFRAGYYDQAHFSKDFRVFTGQNPSEYRVKLFERRATPPPNLVRFLQESPDAPA
jgi:AraC-like DNA-binding protein